MKVTNLLLLSIIVTIISSCGNGEPKVLNKKHISREDFGEKWPFTVEEGTLKCIQYSADGVSPELLRGIVFETDGKNFGINGTAQSWGRDLGYSDISTIWAVDLKMKEELMRMGASEKDATLKIDISPIIAEGLRLCE